LGLFLSAAGALSFYANTGRIAPLTGSGHRRAIVEVELVPTPGEQLASAASAALEPLESAVEVIVSRNDTLDSIFRRLQLSLQDLAAIRGLPGVRHSLDRLRPGDTLKLTSLNGELKSFVRRVNDTQTLAVQRSNDGFQANIIENALDVRPEALRGRIESSLFVSVNDAGGTDATAARLAELFRYDIDFAQELQPDDEFTIIHEKVYRDGQWLRDGEIIAAEFVNNGHTFRAVRYTFADGHSEYFTPDGNSLKKAFLRAPVEFSRISSGFGMRWHPVLNRMRAHKGIDYAAPTGTPIRAAGDGRISFRGIRGGYGNLITIDHAGGVQTVYGHMSRFAKGISPGSRVRQGEVIGYVGSSGLATGPHLHYEYRVHGVFRNPASIKTAVATPISADLKADFLAKTSTLLADLDAAKHAGQFAAVQ
jgi:murein DD-endopeptidase MepM/ murein hydrolase activator NlpD